MATTMTSTTPPGTTRQGQGPTNAQANAQRQGSNSAPGGNEDRNAEDEDVYARLARLEAENAALHRRLGSEQGSTPEEMIPRPKGSAGKDWNIQIEMKLGETPEEDATYHSLLRGIHDVVGNARIPWQIPWASVPVVSKADLFDVARARFPLLAQYKNDWATEELVKQYVRNKRKHAYKTGDLTPPARYSRMKEVARRRSSAARTSRARRGAGGGRRARV